MSEQRFEIGLTMAGAISAGAYTAGVIDFLVEALDAWDAAKSAAQAGGPAVPGHAVSLRVMSGASAGAIVAAILAVDAAGATLDMQNDRGDTALMHAGANEDVVRLLLARGARQELRNEHGWSALHYAVMLSHVGIVEQLCAAPDAAAGEARIVEFTRRP
jgi:predicted acylesterase/phospholipase RssA